MFKLRPSTTQHGYAWGLALFENWCKEKDLDPMDIDNLKFAEFIKEKRQSSKFPKESEKLLKSSVASIYGK